ncbi:RecQ family ATP-dependent DNA helicase [Flavobacteriaceae bacterium]|nr:RecQ family ATP-dependent DNA helicase [Flavobacteriaceae bacterium]
MKRPLDILEKYWGYTSFRPKQEAIINAIIDGKDTVALLPTGGGKSICFQIPSLAQEGICIVISPLVALMTDQVKSLQEKGIKALAITGGKSFTEVNTLLDNASFGNYKFLYLSPERLQQELVQNTIKRMNVNCIAVDEAHCISQWGNDFRPAYKNIRILRELQPLSPIIALTATATPEVLKDTIKELEMELPSVFQDSFVRPNIAYNTLEVEDKLYHVEQLLKSSKNQAIVYVRTRRSAVQTSNHLTSLGIKSDFFHGGIPTQEKIKKLETWKNGNTPTMVATSAFGMGIDLATVAHVIHIQLPESLESYFQEAGRAGRDGNKATATILYNSYDKQLVTKQFIASLADVDLLKFIYKKLNNYLQIPFGEGVFTTHGINFEDFCKTYSLQTLQVFNGLNTLDRLGVLQLSKEFGRSSKIRFLVDSNTAIAYFKHDKLGSVIGKTILRLYGGIFETMTRINLETLQTKTRQSQPVIIETLQKLEAANIIELYLNTTDAAITFLTPREDDKTINVIARDVVAHNTKKKQQVQQLLRYIDNNKTCKAVQLVTYFGETTATPCGICSVCQSKKERFSKKEIDSTCELILLELKKGPKTSREVLENIHQNQALVLKTIALLLGNNTILLDQKNRYFIQ